MAKLLRLVPKLDAVQFRMHDESGLKPGEQGIFWRSVFQMVKQQAPNLRLDLRAKGLPEPVVIGKHALRNALLPVVTILGLSLPGLIGGSVIIESIFAILAPL